MGPNWDERYGAEEYAYGKAPNVFFKQQLDKLLPGSILMPADGEGRNGVYAAEQGWKVRAFDLSKEGKAKALKLAEEKEVTIDYQVGDFADLSFTRGTYDAMGLIYAHFPADKKSEYHKRLITHLHVGGIVIFEAFSKSHLQYRHANPRVGGPPDVDTLFSVGEVRHDFEGFEVILLEETEVQLREGLYHIGTGSVVRFVGRKR